MMKKFVIKTLLFLLPLIALNLFTFEFYSRALGPDLLRLGYIINLFPDYHSVFSKEYKTKIKYSQISENPKDRNFKVLTIGDSFSEQSGSGYKNYLAQNNDIKVLHIDRFLSGNQIQTLYALLNGDFFEKYHFEYVILQNVERHYIDCIEGIDVKKVYNTKELIDSVNAKKNPKIVDTSFKFPSKSILIFPYYTYQYYSTDSYLFDEEVYKTNISRNLFSVGNKTLLFYSYDLVGTKNNNEYMNVYNLNLILNDLSNLLKNKGVKLIVLPSPDKYDIYYEYIVDKKGFPKPMFFERLQKMQKNYIYIDSKKVLSNALNKKKDIYYYDDTHWSPWASKYIATEIEKYIK